MFTACSGRRDSATLNAEMPRGSVAKLEGAMGGVGAHASTYFLLVGRGGVCPAVFIKAVDVL